jgi:hypothetical protein
MRQYEAMRRLINLNRYLDPRVTIQKDLTLQIKSQGKPKGAQIQRCRFEPRKPNCVNRHSSTLNSLYTWQQKTERLVLSNVPSSARGNLG